RIARGVEQPSGQAGADLAVRGEDVVRAAMLHRDAAGDEPGGFVLLEFVLQVGSPAEPGEPVDLSGLGQRGTPLLVEAPPRGGARRRPRARSRTATRARMRRAQLS